MIKIENLSKTFHSGFFKKHHFTAVDNVSFTIPTGETLGLFGESGSGKSTVSRLVLKLIATDSGKIMIDGQDITRFSYKQMQEVRKKMQMISQHPDAALNPRQTIEASLLEANGLHKLKTARDARIRMNELLETTGMHQEILRRYPHQISGGQIQRVVLARALMLNPKVLVLDEPTAMLDVSVQAQVLQLLKRIQQESQLTYLFISHNLDVVRWMCDSLAVMQAGRIVESGPVDLVCAKPKHAYTQKLVNSFRIGAKT